MEGNNSGIRVYVACLAAYNSGVLHGAWIDANQEASDINNAIRIMLAASPIEDVEEHAIHDYEGFEGLSLSEYTSVEEVAELAGFISEHGSLGAELINHLGDIETANEALEDRYCGQYSSVEDFAEEITQETTTIPENLRFYIDYTAMARDLEINDILVIETSYQEVHIFWAH